MYKLIIHGRVQGVGFRAFTQRIANSMNLKGTVKNLADGTVEIICDCKKDKVNKLIHRLKTESDNLKRITNIEIEEISNKQLESGFKIKY